ncbi:MAG: hypothetical protein GY954_09815 [Alteromonas sp.]|nr:hypothetical protein [Alteromonas sp.]
MNEYHLTEKQAFLAMYAFLDDYYQQTGSDDIGGLLGSMSLLEDGGPADPAVTKEWHEAIQQVLGGKVNAALELGK